MYKYRDLNQGTIYHVNKMFGEAANVGIQINGKIRMGKEERQCCISEFFK